MPESVSLRDHFDRILEERDRRYEQRFADQATALTLAATPVSDHARRIATLEADNAQQRGALNVARFLGVGGVVIAVGSLLYAFAAGGH